jgi:phosphoserine phosphatase
MISVIIPVLNESERVRSVIEFAKAGPNVDEVIVVDDGSIDGTPELARDAGAVVITSTLLGKGASMQDGLRVAKNETLLYLDGDLIGLQPDLVARMTQPILQGQADFVKARFTRDAGRVTILTARPLIQTFFPELAKFDQPLGGIIAAHRSLLQRLQFETDYGVDVGLLIDAADAGARIVQADIGHIEHDSQSLEVLGDMATQVTRTILDRAARHARLKAAQIAEVREVERHTQAGLDVMLRKVERAERLALFDMDRVLLDGRFVLELAEHTFKGDVLRQFLDHPTMPAEERTRSIAALFAGVPKEIFEQTARQATLTPGAVETVVGLRKWGYRVGIVTDSFFVASEIIRRRVFADFSVAHLMRFRAGRATGRITLSPAMVHPHGCTEHGICKANVMRHLIDFMGFKPEDILAVGDGENDICMLKAAGLSFAFRPVNDKVRSAAKHVMTDHLEDVLPLAAAVQREQECRWHEELLRSVSLRNPPSVP